MQIQEYLAEVSSIHLELSLLSRRQAELVQVFGADRPLHGLHTLVHRQRQLHARLMQLDALVSLEQSCS